MKDERREEEKLSHHHIHSAWCIVWLTVKVKKISRTEEGYVLLVRDNK